LSAATSFDRSIDSVVDQKRTTGTNGIRASTVAGGLAPGSRLGAGSTEAGGPIGSLQEEIAADGAAEADGSGTVVAGAAGTPVGGADGDGQALGVSTGGSVAIGADGSVANDPAGSDAAAAAAPAAPARAPLGAGDGDAAGRPLSTPTRNTSVPSTKKPASTSTRTRDAVAGPERNGMGRSRGPPMGALTPRTLVWGEPRVIVPPVCHEARNPMGRRAGTWL
jgi:hypothetical protein